MYREWGWTGLLFAGIFAYLSITLPAGKEWYPINLGIMLFNLMLGISWLKDMRSNNS